MSKKIDALFISDVHLGSKGCDAYSVLSVLKKYRPTELFIVGDFIDGWLLRRNVYWTPQFTDVIRKILKLSNNGTTVYYITGNHDDFLRAYSPLSIGNIHIVDEMIWNGYYITHGDKYDGVVQLKWLGVLGAYGYELAIYVDRVFKRFGYKKSISKLLKSKVKEAVKFVTTFERQLSYQASIRGCHSVICGHIHKPEAQLMMIKDAEVMYYNCGDWIESKSYLVYNDGRIEGHSLGV
jgi:UDP-2,3-diacylglucosamine pyrophosphatase LpxH